MRWYSNESTTWMVLRALIAALVVGLLKYSFDLQSVSWVLVLAVPIALLLINFLFRDTSESKAVKENDNPE